MFLQDLVERKQPGGFLLCFPNEIKQASNDKAETNGSYQEQPVQRKPNDSQHRERNYDEESIEPWIRTVHAHRTGVRRYYGAGSLLLHDASIVPPYPSKSHSP